MNREKVFIVLPCFNEIQVIRETISTLIPYGYKIVVVNDGSSQNIFDKISDLPIIYAEHKINLGQGAAIQTGTELALRKGAEYVIHFDSDGQHSVEDIAPMLKILEADKADIVIGSRFLIQEDKQAIPKGKRLLLRFARIVNLVLTGIYLTDAHNGFRALNKRAASVIKMRENRMAHASEILILIRKNKIRYAESSTHIIYSDYSKLKGQSPLNSINIVIDLILNKIFR